MTDLDEDNSDVTESAKIEPIWAIAANIVKERPFGPGGKEIERGTRKFHGGAKVYIVGAYWGRGGQDVKVVGHYRGKYPYIISVIKIAHLENFRAELVYSPTLISRLGTDNFLNEIELPEKAEEMAERLARLAENYRLAQEKRWSAQENSKDTRNRKATAAKASKFAAIADRIRRLLR